MSANQKIWVIDPVQLRNKPGQTKHPADFIQSKEQVSPTENGQSIAETSPESERERNEKRRRALRAVLSYALGPFAILATGQGRRSRFWVSMAGGSAVASTLYVLQWRAFLSRFAGNGFAFLSGFFIACLAIVGGFAAWNRAALLIARNARPILTRLPQWIRKPWVAGSLGFLIPGLGLFIAGRSRRAVCALWSAAALLLSILVLTNGAVLWNWHRAHGYRAVSSHTVEFVFLAFCGFGLIGGIGWIVQARDGARLSGAKSVKPGQSRSDRMAVVLLVAIAAFFVLFDSEYVAETFDNIATLKHQDGFQVIPLSLSLGAMHLNPSRPEYALHTMRLYEEIGREDNAESLRRELRDRLAPCAGFMERCGLVPPSPFAPSERGDAEGSDRIPERRPPVLWIHDGGEIDDFLSIF